MPHTVSRGARTVKRLIKELQELLLMAQGQSQRLLKDFSNELQPCAVLRVITLHA